MRRGAGADEGEGLQPDLPGTRRRASGRQAPGGSEETVKVEPLKKACPRLLKLYGKAVNAMTEYNEARNAVCEANGANSAQVNRLIKASHKGNFEDVRRKVEQEAIIFEAVGEVSPSGAGE